MLGVLASPDGEVGEDVWDVGGGAVTVRGDFDGICGVC